MSTKRKRHKWGEPLRLEYETIRACRVCGLRRITDHNGHPPKVWFLGEGDKALAEMPECDAVE
jgi:hypothetical protein